MHMTYRHGFILFEFLPLDDGTRRIPRSRVSDETLYAVQQT